MKDYQGFRWDILGCILAVIPTAIAIIGFATKLGSTVGLIFLLVAVLVASAGVFVWQRKRLTWQRNRINQMRAFEKGLIQCLERATTSSVPIAVIGCVDATYVIEKDGCLIYREVHDIKNSGPQSPPIHWMEHTFTVDKENPPIKSVDFACAKARCLEPPNLEVLHHPELISERKLANYFLYPEPIAENPRRIAWEFRWPGFWKQLKDRKTESVTYSYEKDSPREIGSVKLTLQLPPGEPRGKYRPTHDQTVGEMNWCSEEEETHAGYAWVSWTFVPERGRNYRLTVSLV